MPFTDVQPHRKKPLIAFVQRDKLQCRALMIAALTSASVLLAGLLGGCQSRPMTAPAPAPAPAPIPRPAPAPAPIPAPPPAPPVSSAPRLPALASWTEYRRRAAQIILASNPDAGFTGPQPPRWQGIATVTVLLNADGSVSSLDLMRGSRVAPHVNDMALAAVRKAANFGPVSNLPGPWQFNETFLYNDNNKFQLITVIENR